MSAIAITLSQRFDSRLWTRLILCISTLYGFWIIYDMDPYLPWRVRFSKGVFWTGIAHFGLWLATLEFKGPLRFLAVPAFVPSIVGIFFLWWTLGLPTAIIALSGAIWLIFRFLKGKAFGV